MNKRRSPGMAYFLFALRWGAILFVAWLLCIAFFFSKHLLPAIVMIVVLGYFFVRDSRAVAKRVGDGIRRTYDPEKGAAGNAGWSS